MTTEQTKKGSDSLFLTHEERNLEMIRQMNEQLKNYAVTDEQIVQLKARLAKEETEYQNQPRVSAQDFLNRTFSSL